MKIRGTDAASSPGWRGRLYGERRRFATAAAGVLAVAIGYHVVFGQNGLTAYRQKREDARALERQVQELERENESLRGHVERLASDPGAIEHQAREELHYTRPGEVIVTLPVEPASTRANVK
jgi:cell division protein FtsB